MRRRLPASIAHCFEHYKDLEPGKWVKIKGWGGIDAAREEILVSIRRFQDAPVKPEFWGILLYHQNARQAAGNRPVLAVVEFPGSRRQRVICVMIV